MSYPEFQKFSQTNSGNTVNCGMCHSHSDGPDGLSFGQIGGLDSLQMEKLKEARRALNPGESVDSPILNRFGNTIVSVVGVRKITEAQKDPVLLAEFLKDSGDLDGDGISNSQEYLDGTDATNPHHGDPVTLFVNNLKKYSFEIIMIILATIFGIYGLSNLIKSFAFSSKET